MQSSNIKPNHKIRKNIFIWHTVTVILIVLCILLSYSNTFYSSWHFDDAINITDNEYLRIDSFSLSNLKSVFMKARNTRRFVANLSFAINYYFHKYDVFGYHLVNTVIHILTGIVLYFFIYLTFSRTSLRDRYGKYAHIIASCSALIFTVHPVQTQSVTYIVQRMSSMATLFYLSSMLFYVKARLSAGRQRILFFIFSLITALFAFGTKENTIVLPIMIFLYDLYFLRDFRFPEMKKPFLFALFLTAIPLAAVMIIFGPQHLSSLLDGYRMRDFTMTERLLTEPRVVLYYLSLLIYPLPSRLNLDYDFPISRSLFDPVTTFISIAAISGLIIFSVIRAKKMPLVSYFILWYFVNLLIESSVFPLEIAYEHRLYLPSVGFFVPAIVFIIRVFEHIKARTGIDDLYLRSSGICLFAIIAVLLSAGTYQRNLIWKDDLSLWSDVVKKSPDKARVHSNLGLAYHEKGLLNEAIAAYKKCLSLKPSYANCHNNIGISYFDKKLVDKAIFHFKNAIAIKPLHADAHYNLGVAYGEKGLLDPAFSEMRRGKELRRHW